MGQLPQLFSILVHFSLVLLLLLLQTVYSAISLGTSVWAGLHFPSGWAAELTAYFSIQTSVKSHYHLSVKIQNSGVLNLVSVLFMLRLPQINVKFFLETVVTILLLHLLTRNEITLFGAESCYWFPFEFIK